MRMVSQLVLEYINLINEDEHQRYKSWEHCYSFFRNHGKFKTDEDIDLACLHLGFYLASWGMYRGSSFLLQKDYKIHKYAVTVLLKGKYRDLWVLDLDAIGEQYDLMDLIFELKEDVIGTYVSNIKKINGQQKVVNVTDTLVTKILLGTVGCTPAYDRYFIEGLKQCGLKHSNFDRKSLDELLVFYKLNKDDFIYVQQRIECRGLYYPIMKLIDMFFWQLGYMTQELKIKPNTEDLFIQKEKMGPVYPLKQKQAKKTSKLSAMDMLREALEQFNEEFEKSDIESCIYNKYKNIHSGTLNCQIYRCTVNKPARVNWYPNMQERITNTKYDLLYELGTNRFEKYDPKKHGMWEIRKVGSKFEVHKVNQDN